MSTSIVFETHSITEDNEAEIATGWWPGRLSARGRELARELGVRRRDDGLSAIFTSDLERAVETVTEALGDTGIPVLRDWRLRECDYGELNGSDRETVHGDRLTRLHAPYPGGESWDEAVERVAGLLRDLPTRWEGQRVLVVGHVATRWALDHHLRGMPLETLAAEEFGWRPGWEYTLE